MAAKIYMINLSNKMETNNRNMVHKTRTGKVWWGNNRVLYVEINDGAEETLNDAWENVALGTKVTCGLEYGLLIDARKLKSITKEARNYYSSNKESSNICVAIIVGNYYSRIIANFFLTFNKPPRPLKLFTCIDEADIWITSKL